MVDLATVAEDVLDGIRPGDVRVHALLRSATTTGDPVLLERLADNLVDNAVRYNVPGGDIRVTTGTIDGRATLTVGNTGPVIPADEVEGLFQPFRRLDERTGDGFGLGLAIVASITTLHDGAVAAHPARGGGLDVTITPSRPPTCPPTWIRIRTWTWTWTWTWTLTRHLLRLDSHGRLPGLLEPERTFPPARA